MGDGHTVLLNYRAGRRGRDVRARLEATLAGAGVRASVIEVRPERIAEAVTDLVERGVHAIPVAGGDGTLRTAARVLVGTGAALSPFPAGTLNHFARRLGVPDLETAARALANGVEREVAVGLAKDVLFLNSCLCGAYADVVRRRERLRHKLGKWPAAAVGFVEVAWRLPLVRVLIQVGPDTRPRETPLLWIGMGRGSFPFTHETQDGPGADELEVVVFRARTRRTLLRLALRFLAGTAGIGRLPDGRDFEVLHTRGLAVESGRRLDATVDGEPLRVQPPLRIHVGPERLRVRTPGP